MTNILITAAAATLLTALAPSAAPAQTIAIPDRVEKLSAKATENVNVTLDGPMLQLAGRFMTGKNGNEQTVKDIVSKLKGIRVRNFQFDKDDQYSDRDLDAIRAQLKAPAWSRIVDANEKDGHTQVFVKQDKGQLGGLVILSAEKRELTIVNIDGTIDLDQLSHLGGSFGIPSGLPNVGAPPESKTPAR